MPPLYPEAEASSQSTSPSNGDGSNHETTANGDFKSKPSLRLITPERLLPSVQPGSNSGSGACLDFARSAGKQVQENQQRRGQAIIAFGQPLEEEGVIPGLGLFLHGQTSHDVLAEENIVKTGFKDPSPPGSKALMLNPGLKADTQTTMALSSDSESTITGVGFGSGSDANVPSSSAEHADLSRTQKLALLKEERDAVQSMYKQKVDEVQWYASKVALLDMHYINALRENYAHEATQAQD